MSNIPQEPLSRRVMNEEERNERPNSGMERTDQRSDGARDRDRVLHSSALRRLANVTQVVDPSEGHVFHNRLTHTLKVAQIGRRLAEKLRKECKGNQPTPEELGGIDPEVVEAAALIHDLGHPPFGHISEEVLDELVVKYGGRTDGYEGNAQSFRIVTRLEVHRDDLEGLNLTRATLNAILKYPWPRHTKEMDERKHKKWGAYRDDSGCFDWVRMPCGATLERTIEAEIMDWADDIAFSVHDLEDFYCAGLIPLDVLVKREEDREACLGGIFKRWDAQPRQKKEHETDRAAFKQAFEELTELLPINQPFTGTVEQRGLLRNTTSNIINRYVTNTSIKPDLASTQLLHIPPELLMEVKVLKELIWYYVIDNPALATQQYGKAEVIKKLFEIYWDVMEPNSKWVYILPKRYQDRFETEVQPLTGPEFQYGKARLIADIIANFTDQEALVTYRRLTGMNPGSLIDMRSPR
ncbi:MAG: dNTP triphosphohydrolase [Caldilineaceae bacterium]|nr:dNTP triphosphohydrolase [Caldilineaceae bacterium]